MVNKDDLFFMAKKAEFHLMNNNHNIHVLKLYISFAEVFLLILRIIKDFSKSNSSNEMLYANSYALLTKQCELLYESMLMCILNDFHTIINKKVDNMNISNDYKDIVKEFLFQLLNNNKIEDLSYILPLLDNIEIIKKSSPIINKYEPGVITLAGAETRFLYRNGMIDEKEKSILNSDNFLINVWTKVDFEQQKECLKHELAHIILQPNIMEVGVDIHRIQEDKVERYLNELNENSKIKHI